MKIRQRWDWAAVQMQSLNIFYIYLYTNTAEKKKIWGVHVQKPVQPWYKIWKLIELVCSWWVILGVSASVWTWLGGRFEGPFSIIMLYFTKPESQCSESVSIFIQNVWKALIGRAWCAERRQRSDSVFSREMLELWIHFFMLCNTWMTFLHHAFTSFSELRSKTEQDRL